jgi:prevent-host-death family protein
MRRDEVGQLFAEHDLVAGLWYVVTMRRMGIRELRDNLTKTIRRVRAGETIEITDDGEPVALLTPIREGRIERLIARGDITPGKTLARPIRRLPATGPLTASEILARDREGR